MRRSTLIFGGKSPIAIAIAAKISESNKTPLLVTRNINNFDKKLINSEIQLIQIDLNNFNNEIIKNVIIEFNVDSIVFMHRYGNDPENLHDRMQVEIHSPLAVIDNFIKYSQISGFRPVIFGSSPAARVIQNQQSIGYHVSKAAQLSMVKYLAAKFGKQGFRFNCVSPGAYIQKERSRSYYNSHPELVNSINELIPVGRFGTVTDISYLIKFLLSEDSSYINGVSIDIDGGLHVRDPSVL